jgi:hypothetical protein
LSVPIPGGDGDIGLCHVDGLLKDWGFKDLVIFVVLVSFSDLLPGQDGWQRRDPTGGAAHHVGLWFREQPLGPARLVSAPRLGLVPGGRLFNNIPRRNVGGVTGSCRSLSAAAVFFHVELSCVRELGVGFPRESVEGDDLTDDVVDDAPASIDICHVEVCEMVG